MLKPSTLVIKKGFFKKYKICEKIKKFLKKHGFQIIEYKHVKLNKRDVELFYQYEIDKAKNENEEKGKAISAEYYRVFHEQQIILLLVYHPNKNALEYGTLIKGQSFYPTKCEHNTIRYKYRDKKWDDVPVEPGKIISPPNDNVIHCPKRDIELVPILKRFFPEFLNSLCI